MTRECYTLGRIQGQTKKAFGVCRCRTPKLEGILRAGDRHPGKRVHHPRRLVAFSPERQRREVRRIGFHEQTVSWNQPHQIVVSPFVESDNAAEGDVPSRVEGELGEGMRACVTVKNSENASRARIADHRAGIVFRVPGMDDDRLVQLTSEGDLSRESRALGLAGSIIVVIVQTALSDRHRSRVSDQGAELRNVARGIELGRVVRVDARRRKNEPSICRGIIRRERCRRERFTNADDRRRARIAGAGYYRVAVAAEGRVREVGVAVDEDWRAVVLRGHLRSIQRSTGAAT